jgi:exopolysaccharide biosynthesis polyprenyl glycosylphosphotransferase
VSSSAPLLDASIEFSVGLKLRRTAKRLSPAAQRRLFLAALVISDALLLMAAFGLAYLVRFQLDVPVFQVDALSHSGYYFRLSLASMPIWLVLFWAHRLYNWQILLGGMQEYSRLFQACVVGAILIALAQFFVEQLIVARGWVGLIWLLTFALVAGGRLSLRHLAYAARRRGYLQSPALMLGANVEGRLLGQQLLAWPTSGISLLGYLDDEVPAGSRVCGNLYTLGTLDHLEEMVRKYRVEELILATSGLSREKVLEVFRSYGASPGIHLRMSSGLFELMTTGLEVKELAYVPLIGVNRVRLTGTERVIKTLLDYGLTLLGLLLLAPLFLLIAVVIKLDSHGPVLYRRRVMGLNGRQFDALKFRTMRIDGDAILAANPKLMDELATAHKIKGDPRITRAGWVLRKFSLDELPQLFNVLKGDMSLVGPRIISLPELKDYGHWATNLLTVRPGLTGLWQVSGRSDVPYEERVWLDMFYIRNYSIWLDLQLIARTIPVVLSGKGAY